MTRYFAELANASRIFPLVTTAHGLSGSNNRYRPGMYTDLPIVEETRNHVCNDTPAPGRFGMVSPFNQAELWREAEMTRRENGYSTAIPADYTPRSPYLLQYYFELGNDSDSVWLYLGFVPDPSNQPYFVVRVALEV